MMTRMIWHRIWLALTLAMGLVPAGVGAQPQLLATGTRTIFLDASAHSFSVPSSVAYHPGFDRYYASDTGNSDRPAFVFTGAGGAPDQTLQPLNVDARAWNFNPNDDALEIVSYNAVSGGVGLGLIAPGIDAGGMLTGATAELLPSMPGNDGSQTAPAYDPVADVYYSRSSSSSVNVVRRSDGTLAGTILLDFATAGIGGAYADGIVFVPEAAYLGVLDNVADQLVVFDLVGAYVGSVSLDIGLTSTARRPGYANGQLFAFDEARGGWQGYAILDAGCLIDTDCDDGNTCTVDACDATLQCANTDVAAGFDQLACLLRRLRAPDPCADAVPTKLGRVVSKQAAKAQAQADGAERTLAEGGSSTRAEKLLGKAAKSLNKIDVKVAKAASSNKPSKQISADCANTIGGLTADAAALLATLP